MHLITQLSLSLLEHKLKEEGSASTPDVLILDDLYINDKLVTWVDSKNYYGSTSFSFLKKLEKQIKRYDEAFGLGAVIFRLGLNKKMTETFKNTLFIDSGPLPIDTNKQRVD